MGVKAIEADRNGMVREGLSEMTLEERLNKGRECERIFHPNLGFSNVNHTI